MLFDSQLPRYTVWPTWPYGTPWWVIIMNWPPCEVRWLLTQNLRHCKQQKSNPCSSPGARNLGQRRSIALRTSNTCYAPIIALLTIPASWLVIACRCRLLRVEGHCRAPTIPRSIVHCFSVTACSAGAFSSSGPMWNWLKCSIYYIRLSCPTTMQFASPSMVPWMPFGIAEASFISKFIMRIEWSSLVFLEVGEALLLGVVRFCAHCAAKLSASEACVLVERIG